MSQSQRGTLGGSSTLFIITSKLVFSSSGRVSISRLISMFVDGGTLRVEKVKLCAQDTSEYVVDWTRSGTR